MIETVPIEILILDPANARKHDKKNLEAIKGSLARFGQQKPLVVGSDNVIIAGNGTLEAARALGWTEINIVRSDLKGIDRTAYSIADNRTGEISSWDLPVLSQILEDLKVQDFDIEQIAFDDSFIIKIPDEGIPQDKDDNQWTGMPEFENTNKLGIQRIVINFETYDDVQNFAQLINQSITEKTRAIWYPKVEKEKMINKYYEQSE